MNSFLKGFFSIFDWMFTKTLEESMTGLDNQMQDLYDRMGWGKYSYPTVAHNAAADINRVLEAEQQFNNAVDDYMYRTKQSTIIVNDHNPVIKDPSRPRINKYL